MYARRRVARIRSIKPDFWTDEKIVFLSPWARLLFIGLWNFADDAGRMAYSPMRLKMQIFPNDSIEIHPLIEELNTAKLVTVYQNGTQVLQIVNFGKHQKIDTRTESRLPPPGSTDSPQIPPEIPQEGKGVDGKRNRSVKEKTKPSVAVAPVDPRKAVVRDAIKKGWQWKNPDKGSCPWGPAEEVAITALLADVAKDLPDEALVQCVRNKFLSDESHTRKPREYIRFLLTYMESPFDRYGKPKNLGGGNGKAQERTNNNRKAILTGFGISPPDGQDAGQLPEPANLSGNGNGMARVLDGDSQGIRDGEHECGSESLHVVGKRLPATTRADPRAVPAATFD